MPTKPPVYEGLGARSSCPYSFTAFDSYFGKFTGTYDEVRTSEAPRWMAPGLDGVKELFGAEVAEGP
jgi:hypothetical protein